jgi:hypothetical protein
VALPGVLQGPMGIHAAQAADQGMGVNQMRGRRGKCVTGRAGHKNGLMPLRDIANDLQINVKTVRQDLAGALAKLRTSNELTEFARLVAIRERRL